MSTKIYNGFAIKLSSPIEVFDALRELAIDAMHVACINYATQFINNWVTELDWTAMLVRQGRIQAEELSRLSYAHMIQKRREALKELSMGWRNPHEDWDFSIVFAPHAKLQWLGISYTEQKSFENLLSGQSWYQTYSYWDNTDQPDEITDEEWSQRKNAWNIILPDGVPARNMATFTLCENRQLVHPDRDLVLNNAPSKQSRIDTLVTKAARDEFLKGYKSASEFMNGTSEFMNHLMEFERGFIEGGPYWSLRERFLADSEDIVYSNDASTLLDLNQGVI